MIRINLLGGEWKPAHARPSLMAAHRVAVACGSILVLAGLGIGWRYWLIDRASKQVDADIAAAQRETARLHSVIEQVQQFEQRKAQLQQRVSLIEQLRREQTGPVHMLDQVSRALPPLLWLTQLKQAPGSADVLIDGRSASLTGLSDFVANLEASGYFKRSIEIVSTATETAGSPPVELTRFQIKAVFQAPADAGPGAQQTAVPRDGGRPQG